MFVLPEMMMMGNGKRVGSVDEWRVRRGEILELFRSQVYGRNPAQHAEGFSCKLEHVDPEAMNGAATLKQVRISFKGPRGHWSFPLALFVPNRRKGGVRCFLLISIGERNRIDPTRQHKHPNWPAEMIIDRGYAAAALYVDDLAPNDRPATQVPPSGLPSVRTIFDEPGVKPAADSWGVIGQWAWGAMRAMDYLQVDPEIDGKRVAVVGHSRAGKTALWAGAQDERFSLVISNNSGCTGAALARGKEGAQAERISSINRGFPLWFCENYKKYNDREDSLPLDQHMLLGLISPRLLYVASSSEDEWAHPPSEFAAAVAAQDAWGVYGKKGVGSSVMPEIGRPLHGGSIGYHVRQGEHELTEIDWAMFMDFADRHWAE